MARIRSLKPEMWMSPQVMNLTHGARLMFIGLITQADDEGRGIADPRKLKAAIFGGDDVTAADVRRMIDECVTQALVELYYTETHGLIYALPSWKSHQKIDRARKSLYPVDGARRTLVEGSTTPRRGSDLTGEDRRGSERIMRVEPSSSPDVEPFDLLEGIRAVYPAGTFGGQNWILTERELGKLLDAGETPDALRQAAVDYAAQQAATGATGTQFIRSPAKFYAEGHWRGPFPMPAQRAQPGARQSFAEVHSNLQRIIDAPDEKTP